MEMLFTASGNDVLGMVKQSNAEQVSLGGDQVRNDSIIHDGQKYKHLGLYIYTFELSGE